MVLVEHFAGALDIGALLRLFVPRQLEAGVEIGVLQRALRGAHGLLHHARELLHELFTDVGREMQRLELLAVVLEFLKAVVVFAELALDDLQLLAEEKLLLRLVHLLVRALVEVLFDGHDGDLAREEAVEQTDAREGFELFEQGLLFLGLHVDVLGDKIGDVAGIVRVRDLRQQFGRQRAEEVNVFVKQGRALPDEGFRARGGKFRFALDRQNGGDVVVFLGVKAQHPCALLAFDEYTRAICPRDAEQLLDAAKRADLVEIALGGNFLRNVALRDDEHGAVAGEGRVERGDGALADDVKVYEHSGKDGQPAHRQQRIARLDRKSNFVHVLSSF